MKPSDSGVLSLALDTLVESSSGTRDAKIQITEAGTATSERTCRRLQFVQSWETFG
jgi:hypothetical protein